MKSNISLLTQILVDCELNLEAYSFKIGIPQSSSSGHTAPSWLHEPLDCVQIMQVFKTMYAMVIVHTVSFSVIFDTSSIEQFVGSLAILGNARGCTAKGSVCTLTKLIHRREKLRFEVTTADLHLV